MDLDFLNRIHSQTYIDTESLLSALKEPSPVSIRVNSGKWNKKPSGSNQVPWSPKGYYLTQRPSYTLDPLFHSGCYYPQEASGMFLEEAVRQTCDFKENLRVLDLCAAPGGKSIILSDMSGSNGLLISNETIRSRSAILSETITKWGAVNTIVTQNDPAAFARLPSYFDIIFVDAPCSGEGMFRNETAVNEWSVPNTVHCSERQKRILMDVWPALKENGILIYSTCTFNPGENEENLKWFCTRNEADNIGLDISAFPGITEIDFEGLRGYGFYPGRIKGEGFFISVLRKTGKQEKVHFPKKKNSTLLPGKHELALVEKWTNFSAGRILRWKDEIFAVPYQMDDYIHLFQNLRIVKTGTKLFAIKQNDVLPSHELSLSQSLRPDAFPSVELSVREALAYLHRDNLSLNYALPGWNLVTYKGVNLGFIKNLGNRVNNYFPSEWRIRMNLPDTSDDTIKWII